MEQEFEPRVRLEQGEASVPLRGYFTLSFLHCLLFFSCLWDEDFLMSSSRKAAGMGLETKLTVAVIKM